MRRISAAVVLALVAFATLGVAQAHPRFGDGSYVVGTDIAPGTYRTRVASSGCYWQRLAGFSGTLADVIANDFSSAVAVVTISPSDAGFSSSGCSDWTTDLSAITDSPISPFGDGTFIVGTDVAPGTWRSSGGASCYWSRLAGFSGTLSDVIANDFGGSSIVTISSDDRGFASSGCGSWSKIR